ncbi:MAG TPA: hypothetical protein VFE17_05230 [Candidatus Baltobacteraceae bacterium]|jgi:hypothetical protein|nr:hypothetical protein [Candidatus Baltobacteraceae bacterium]
MRFFGGGSDDDDTDVDQYTINEDLRDGIKKELERTDLSPEDRKSYENALANLDKEEQSQQET